MTKDNLIFKLEQFIEKMPFLNQFGIKVCFAKKGHVQTRLDIRKNLSNHFGTFQAGACYTLAEITGGLLCATFLNLDENLLITKESRVSFLHIPSETIIAEAKLEQVEIDKILDVLAQKRKIDISIESNLRPDGNERVGIKCVNTYYLRKGMPKSFLKFKK